MLCEAAPYISVPVLSRTCNSPAPARVIHPHPSLVSCFNLQLFRQPRLILRAAATRGGRFVPASPSRKKVRRRDARVVEINEDDEDDVDTEVSDEYEEVEVEEEGDDDDDVDGDVDGDEMLPLDQMRKWFDKKPKGFGEGKEYDTSVEDKLLEELQKSKEAQAENLKKLKNNPVNAGSVQSEPKKKDVVPSGGRVRLVNLPKKKNIHRDLKSALQGIPGIMNIVPAVSGNKKTRDPVCKGFAFVDFKRKEDAAKFVELYSGQAITFGKIQKQIECELVDAQSSSSTSIGLSKNLGSLPLLPVSSFEEDSNEDSIMDGSALSSWDKITSDDSDSSDDSDYSDNMDNETYEEEEEEEEEEKGVGDSPESATAMSMDYDNSVDMIIDSENDLLSSEQVDKTPIAEQNSPSKIRQEHKKPKEKAKKVSNSDVPGSAKRLRVKEKAVLSDVFSKYGSKAALASKDS
ncbi:hypothetical protein Lal_00015885 [Lupinus albus]|uniref:Putative RNA recognition motif domain-containing protein n=1 Tax=Lupinus albus TaxID=3870 RepID=A0A6A5MDU6_LUPAL|nr:putative RNA recognition motif domain-containing protein [Lupinus albus]KAF1872794.1 hypothetical protein Lal_00015885 [Lupinus albus]